MSEPVKGEADAMREWALERVHPDEQWTTSVTEYVDRHYPGGVEGFRNHLRQRHGLYPYPDGDVLVLGPGVIALPDRSVIAWEAENYEPQGVRATIVDWLRGNAAGRIGASAGGDPWYVARKLADAIEQGAPRMTEVDGEGRPPASDDGIVEAMARATAARDIERWRSEGAVLPEGAGWESLTEEARVRRLAAARSDLTQAGVIRG